MILFLNVIEMITLTLIYGLERYRGSNKKQRWKREQEMEEQEQEQVCTIALLH